MTRNVTMAFPDDVLDGLRIYAAERKTTVNALFRAHANELLGLEKRRKEAREWMHRKALENIARDEARAAARARGEDAGSEETWRWSREETYADRQWPKGD
ncbi:MAG: hypothetical protein LBV50_01935 [Novosphingobium sp.]|jgi:hypothetical protein|nr:hypothetical protein [Novosphingobium sp.]